MDRYSRIGADKVIAPDIGSVRDARRGGVRCEHSKTPTKAEVGCRCLWGCYIGQGEKAKPKHIRLALDWLCQVDHSRSLPE